MTEPLPQHFGITQEQADHLDSEVKALAARMSKPPIFNVNYSTYIVVGFAASCWLVYVLAGKAPSISGKFLLGFGALCIGAIWMALTVSIAQHIIFKICARRAKASLRELERSPLYEKYARYREAQKAMLERLRQLEQHWQRRKEEWARWQREWSKGKTEFWRSLDGVGFERELASLYTGLGFEASLTAWSGDDGVDILLRKDGKKIVVQCKAHNKPAGPAMVRELFGSMYHFEADEAVLACTSGFTQNAIRFAKGKPIKLIDLADILRMQATLLRNEPDPPQPLRYGEEKLRARLQQAQAETPPTALQASRYQKALSYAVPSIVGVTIVLGHALLIPSRSAASGPVRTGSASATPPTPTPYKSYTTYSPTPSPQPSLTATPTPELAEEETYYDPASDEPEVDASPESLPPPSPAVSALNQNTSSNPTGAGDSDTSTTGINSNGSLRPGYSYSFEGGRSREDERRLSKANDLKKLGIQVDWRTHSWLELIDIERRARKAADLLQLGYDVDWRRHTWLDMMDWERRIRKADDLKGLGLSVDWREHEWLEMHDWERRIRKANDLRLYGINVNWRQYTWLQMYEMEKRMRKDR